MNSIVDASQPKSKPIDPMFDLGKAYADQGATQSSGRTAESMEKINSTMNNIDRLINTPLGNNPDADYTPGSISPDQFKQASQTYDQAIAQANSFNAEIADVMHQSPMLAENKTGSFFLDNREAWEDSPLLRGLNAGIRPGQDTMYDNGVTVHAPLPDRGALMREWIKSGKENPLGPGIAESAAFQVASGRTDWTSEKQVALYNGAKLLDAAGLSLSAAASGSGGAAFTGTQNAAYSKVKWAENVGGIKLQGMPFEEYVAARYPSVVRLEPNAKTFDFQSLESSGLLMSAKTLNTVTDSRLQKPGQIYSTIKGYVDDASGFTAGRLGDIRVQPGMIKSRELVIGLPATTPAAQIQQIQRAVNYGAGLKSNPVRVTPVYINTNSWRPDY